MKKIDQQKLSRVLYERDPANTSCKENLLTDEYDFFAWYVANESNHENFREALVDGFKMIFSMEDDEIPYKNIDTIVSELTN